MQNNRQHYSFVYFNTCIKIFKVIGSHGTEHRKNIYSYSSMKLSYVCHLEDQYLTSDLLQANRNMYK
jgi:hypothetical protein